MGALAETAGFVPGGIPSASVYVTVHGTRSRGPERFHFIRPVQGETLPTPTLPLREALIRSIEMEGRQVDTILSQASENLTHVTLYLNEGSDGILALRAAKALLRDGHKDCVYAYEDGAHIWAYRTKRGVVAREEVR